MSVEVKVSAASARLRFHGCDPDYIRDRCRGRCCEGTSGLMVAVHQTERQIIESQGGEFIDRSTGDSVLLKPINPHAQGAAQRCPFKEKTNLCALHSSTKPFGCVASPFTLNKNNTLIVRNRYKLLVCYNDGPRLPAYVAFRTSLNLIFGCVEAARICTHLEQGGGDILANMPNLSWHILQDNDAVKRHD